jgi:polar amino acid transport system ATP-binding protein
MISVKNLKKAFGDNLVLRDVDLEVKQGEVVVVVGSVSPCQDFLLPTKD